MWTLKRKQNNPGKEKSGRDKEIKEVWLGDSGPIRSRGSNKWVGLRTELELIYLVNHCCHVGGAKGGAGTLPLPSLS